MAVGMVVDEAAIEPDNLAGAESLAQRRFRLLTGPFGDGLFGELAGVPA